MNQTLDISWETILKIGLAILVFYFLFLVKDILVFVFFASIISVLFNPAINFLEERKIPRVISSIFVYLSIFLILGFLIYTLAPLFVSESQQFSQLLSQYLQKLSPTLKFLGFRAVENLEDLSKILQEWLQTSSTSIVAAIGSIFGGVISTFSILALAFFFSLEEKEMENMVSIFLPEKYRPDILSLLENAQKRVSIWFGARILSCFFIGFLTFLVCYILKINYSTSFSFLAGFLEIVPTLGPIIAGVIISLFTALDSLWKALLILISFFLIQQIEGNILTPILTKKLIGLPSVFVLIALMIGGKLFGILGAILAIPLFGFLFEFLSDFLKKKNYG
ncbi:hypothetical protein AMJ49_00725 [Parcubacteria bacterium DG_74_2]|nr:MAG: hypothetical protein AMJ49_00725 [Parcubacteria bacterium DG_74_2]